MAHSQVMPSPVALPGVSKIVAVGSGKGGVGKTTVAVNLAIALSKLGQRVGLMDADVYGPNVPLMMGSSQSPKIGAGNTIEPNLTHGLKTISIGYISPGDKPLVMRGPMLHQIIPAVFAAGELGRAGLSDRRPAAGNRRCGDLFGADCAAHLGAGCSFDSERREPGRCAQGAGDVCAGEC